MVSVKRGVMAVVAAFVDRQPGLDMLAATREIADVVMARPLAMMCLQQKFWMTVFERTLQDRIRPLEPSVEALRDPPPAPVDREVRELLRHLAAYRIGVGVQRLRLRRSRAF